MFESKGAQSNLALTNETVEIGNLKIKMDKIRTSKIKSQILEARFDEHGSKLNTGSKSTVTVAMFT